jgi:hypothetical protein
VGDGAHAEDQQGDRAADGGDRVEGEPDGQDQAQGGGDQEADGHPAADPAAEQGWERAVGGELVAESDGGVEAGVGGPGRGEQGGDAHEQVARVTEGGLGGHRERGPAGGDHVLDGQGAEHAQGDGDVAAQARLRRQQVVGRRVECVARLLVPDGEELPLATLYLAFGKPMFVPDLLPPLLSGDVQCYWTQRPGYDLDERSLRQIIYDYAYLRPTWTRDKSARYADVEAQRSLWEHAPTLGLGRRVGAFWYPISEQESARTTEEV